LTVYAFQPAALLSKVSVKGEAQTLELLNTIRQRVASTTYDFFNINGLLSSNLR
jgi:hypothetical protein